MVQSDSRGFWRIAWGDRSARSAATAHRASTAKLAATESKVRIAGAMEPPARFCVVAVTVSCVWR